MVSCIADRLAVWLTGLAQSLVTGRAGVYVICTISAQNYQLQRDEPRVASRRLAVVGRQMSIATWMAQAEPSRADRSQAKQKRSSKLLLLLRLENAGKCVAEASV